MTELEAKELAKHAIKIAESGKFNLNNVLWSLFQDKTRDEQKQISHQFQLLVLKGNNNNG